nr:hypothetical protein GCM10020093_100330 [Planobispora longispora]
MVGQTTWRIVDDAQRVYTGPATLVRWTGSPPGVFEIQVINPPEPFRSAPYPFRMRLFTSTGVREFEIPAPPPVPRPPETEEERIAEAAKRISDCYTFSTLLTRVKALQVFWLPTPQPVIRTAQHWLVAIRGLDGEDRVNVWDAHTRELLAETRPYAGGLTEVSLVLPAGQAVRALQLTLNEEPPIPMETYARRVAALRGRDGAAQHTVLIRQTPLHTVAEIALGRAAETVVPQRDRERLSLFTRGPDGFGRIDLDPLDPGRHPVGTRVEPDAAPGGNFPEPACGSRGRPTRDAR